jgi:16S rRNA processing protein RimM
MVGVALTGKNPIVLGRVSGLFGVKGWVKIYSYTDPKEAILEYSDCLLATDKGWVEAVIAEGQLHGKAILARFDGVGDRDAAAELVGREIAVPRSDLPQAEEGRYYWSDLEGLTVVRKNGTTLGVVSHLLGTGAHDVLVVKGKGEILIPFVPDEYVLGVDLDKGEIVVDWDWD